LKLSLHCAAALLAAFAPLARAEVLYTVLQNSDVLCTVDTSTGVVTQIGPLGVPFSYGDLAFDTSTGTMYMVDGWGGGIQTISTLYTVDLNTGAATHVGSTGARSLFGLVYHPTLDKLFASVSTDSPTAFYEINRASGAATLIGNPGNYLDGLTYVGSTGQIAGLFAGSQGSLHAVDPMTGAGTLLSAGSGFVNNCGIAWGSTNDEIFAIDVSGILYSFDVANGYARTTLHTGLGSCDGLASDSGGCALPSAYCTAGTTTNGCVPSIG
jgi:hypothetical protein